MIPEMLTNCVMFVDGVSFSGDVPSMTLPKLSIKSEEYRGGGMSGPV
ncbi:MAG: phage major tail tube protein, partial [Polaromonas sp.]|nr:phage major tail tube protein [Polaromonas sp.]